MSWRKGSQGPSCFYFYSFLFFPYWTSTNGFSAAINPQVKLTKSVVTTLKKDLVILYCLLYQADFFASPFSSHCLDHLPTTLFLFITSSRILLCFIAMVCVALTSYQFISQLCCLNYCQNDSFMFLLQALEKLITWTETFCLSMQSLFQMVDITLSNPLFSVLKLFGLAVTFILYF